MGYPLRDEVAGALYHVGTRGNNQRNIFTNARSYQLFLLIFGAQAKAFGWEVIAYCLMKNHYHLVIRIGDRGLSRGMQRLNGGYARAFNAREGRRDHLFGRRFWSRMIEDECDLLATCRYVHLNPTRSFGVLPEDWLWSGHRALAGVEEPRTFHSTDMLWSLLHSQPRQAMDSYLSFMTEAFETRPVSDTR
jgi:REP element-mobilizing transposase RayT